MYHLSINNNLILQYFIHSQIPEKLLITVMAFLIISIPVHQNYVPGFVGQPTAMSDSTVQIIGHRGAAGLAPENTLPGLEKAIALGLAYAEVDIQMTKDGAVVLMHDKTVDRTTNGKGKVGELSLEEIKKLDAGSKFSSDFKGTKVPTLQEALELIKTSSTTLVIEIKSPELYPGIKEKVHEIISKYDAFDNCYIISFDTAFVDKLKATYPKIRIGHLYLKPPKKMVDVPFISVHYFSATFFNKRIQQHRQNGTRVWVWTVNNTKKLQSLQSKGIDGITTDYPNLVR